ncbi:MAG: ABC transporter permease, partial [Mangrovibacterium sp.]
MIQLKRILKSILKYKTSSGLTLLSLVISFTGIIILTLYVSFEKSFDRFHTNRDSIYRLELRGEGSWLPAKMSTVIKNQIPEVGQITRLSSNNAFVTTPELNETNTKFEADCYWADSVFFNMFSFSLLLGDKTSVLNDPHSAVISESLSKKMFGGNNPVGQTLLTDNISYHITGVMKDFPKNSSLQADCILPFSVYTAEKRYDYFDEWSEWSFNNLMMLKPGTDPDQVAAKIEKLAEIEVQIKQEKAGYSGAGTFVYLRPLADIHYINDGFFAGYTNPVVLNVF